MSESYLEHCREHLLICHTHAQIRAQTRFAEERKKRINCFFASSFFSIAPLQQNNPSYPFYTWE